MNPNLPNEHQCERMLAHTFEWAYHGEREKGVLTARMNLPSFSRMQQYFSNPGIDRSQYDEFVDTMISDWRAGAIISYFHPDIRLGRYIQKIKDVKFDEPELIEWAEHSSQLSKALLLHESKELQVFNPQLVAKHILQTFGSIRGVVGEPTVPTDAVTSDR